MSVKLDLRGCHCGLPLVMQQDARNHQPGCPVFQRHLRQRQAERREVPPMPNREQRPR